MSSSGGQSGGVEQRRFARVPINLDGLLSINRQAAVPCTVRDFCVGGMFVTADPSSYANVQPDTPAVLYFALFVDGEKQDHQIDLIIARAVAKGIGVSFSSPDPKALALLGQLAAPDGMPSLPENAEAIGASQQGFRAQYAQIESPLKALAKTQVETLCQRFLDRSDDVLFLGARDADNNVEQNQYLDGQRELRDRHGQINQQVAQKIDLGLSILGNPLDNRQPDPQSIGLSDLSLVEKDEFEEFLVVSEMVSELEPQFQKPLFELEQRFSFLANKEIDQDSLPIGPSIMCNAVAECLKGLQSDRRVVAAIYKTLHAVMSESLDEFYQAVNELFVKQGILPVIDPDKPVIKRQSNTGSGFAPAADEPLERSVPPVEENLAELMPGPEGYQGRPTLAPAHAPANYPPQQVNPAQPQFPAGQIPAAPPPYPAGQVLAAPPQVPAGQVYAAPPQAPAGQMPMPAAPSPGQIQAAPPVLPAGVEIAPPSAAPGVHAAPPGMQAGVQVAAPSMPVGGQLVTGAPQVYGGWSGTATQFAQPVVQRAYSAAQAQLALRRELFPGSRVAHSDTVQERGLYSTSQVVDGLSSLQIDYANTQNGDLLDVEQIKQRITDSLIRDGAPEKMVGDQAIDAIEVVANLFGALMHDRGLAKNAKSQLSRLQPSVHRAALVDPEFFESSDHPVRQFINRVSRLRDGASEQQQQRSSRVNDLVGEVNRNFDNDVAIFNRVATELDGILDEQEIEYRERVADVVASCEQQQQVLEARRGQSLEETDGGSDRSDLPEEWNKWLDRSRKLTAGQRVMLNATSPRATPGTLAWKEHRNNLFVFVDEQGTKSSQLTLQQVAMHLRRGIIVVLEDDDLQPAVERAMAGVVQRFHTQVENQATRDALTGFLLGKYFGEEVDAALPENDSQQARDAVICYLSIDNLREINDSDGTEAGDEVLKTVAETLSKDIRGKEVIFGRLEGSVLGVYWPRGGIEAAYKKLQVSLASLNDLAVHLPEAIPADEEATRELAESRSEAATVQRTLKPQVVAGITASADNLVDAEGLINAAREACDSAREMGPGSIYVTGNESEQRRQLEQLVAYADKALERDCLTLSAHHVVSMTESDLLPSICVAVSARDRNDKPLPPSVFAPALARCSIASDIDLWSFRKTLTWLMEHEEEAETFALVMIPLSSASVKNEDLPNLLMAEFMETPVPPGRICFTLPDHDVVENLVEVSELIATLKEFGCRFVLDEFGSGHENYDYIKSVDVDFVSVKTNFISDAKKNPKDFAMAKSINELVHFMGKKTIGKQASGLDLGDTMKEIGIDFLNDQTDKLHLVPEQADD